MDGYSLDETRPEKETSWENLVRNLIDKKRDKTIYVVLPEDQPSPALNETSIKKTTTVEKVIVKDHNTFNVENIKKEKIKQIQFLHTLAKDVKEFELLSTKFWLKNVQENIDLDEFGLYVLGLRELVIITKNQKFELKNISNFAHLKALYLENQKYLIFSKNNHWHHLVVYHATWIEHTIKSYNNVEFVKFKFSDDELKKLIATHFEHPSYIDKMLQWLKKTTEFNLIIDLMKTYHKNFDLFQSYEVDFNIVKINDQKSLSIFIENVQDVNAYKILTRLLQRLDSVKRQDVRKHKYLFDDYFSLCKKIYKDGIAFERLEPVLRKIHTYNDASYFYNALKGIINPHNLYDTHQLVLATKGAKVLYFNEAKQTMLVRVKSFKAMSEIGSQNWCIARSMKSYLSYRLGFLGFSVRKFFIYYDANIQHEEGKQNFRQVGLTVFRGRILHAHDYGDYGVLHTDFIQQMIQDNRKWFKSVGRR